MMVYLLIAVSFWYYPGSTTADARLSLLWPVSAHADSNCDPPTARRGCLGPKLLMIVLQPDSSLAIIYARLDTAHYAHALSIHEALGAHRCHITACCGIGGRGTWSCWLLLAFP